MSDLTRNFIRPETVAMRPAPLHAMRFDGTDAGAQAIALWVKESGDITSRSQMRYHAASDGGRGFLFDVVGDGGEIVDPGDWVVRLPGGMYLVLAQDAFDAIFDRMIDVSVPMLTIEETR